MVTTMAGPDGVFEAGATVATDDSNAHMLIANGYAVFVVGESAGLTAPEAAAVEPAERAMMPDAKRRKAAHRLD
jgi:hypothetical protein